MSKAIRSYPKSERLAVVIRRQRGSTGGLGYLAAKDAMKKIKKQDQAEKK